MPIKIGLDLHLITMVPLRVAPITVLLTMLCMLRADYTFGTWDRAFLEVNFHPVLFDLLPYVWLGEGICMSRELVQHIIQCRSQGVSFEQIARVRNEAVASRCVGRDVGSGADTEEWLRLC